MLSLKGDLPAQESHPPPRRYYLHIVSEYKVYADYRGVMLSDLATAHRRAVSLIWKCMISILRRRIGDVGTSGLPTTPAEAWLSFFFRPPGRTIVNPGESYRSA